MDMRLRIDTIGTKHAAIEACNPPKFGRVGNRFSVKCSSLFSEIRVIGKQRSIDDSLFNSFSVGKVMESSFADI